MAIIGIDLGTTNSLAAYWNQEKAQIITNSVGEVMTPSVIGVDDDGSLVVGRLAKEREVTHHGDTVRSFKRFMGTDKLFSLGDKTYTATELSAMVLKKIKEDVEAQLGETVKEAIVTVPAYFNDNQRSATKKAAALAGLPVERLINEPSAAALAYRMRHGEQEDMSLLIFDFGGGTLDISLVECFENVIEIIAIVGDNHMGGDDIDDVIVELFCQKHNLDFGKLDGKTQADMKKHAEMGKIQLAKKEENEICISMDVDGVSRSLTLTNEVLFEECMPMFRKIRSMLYQILEDADYNIRDIQDLVMVGGSSNLPVVKQFLQELLHKEPVIVEGADVAVALGVGTYAGIRERNQEIKDLVLTDVCPFTLGVNVINHGQREKDRLLPVIERNATLPASHSVNLYTAHDYQSKISLDIFQGEEYYAEDNIFLGNVSIDVPKKRAGEEKILVTYTYDINGILQVEAINSRGQKRDILLSNRELTEEEQKRIQKEFEKIKIQPMQQETYRILKEQLLYCFEHSIGIKRQQTGFLLQAFEQVLQRGTHAAIHRVTKQVEDWLNQKMMTEEEMEQYFEMLREDVLVDEKWEDGE